MTQLISKISIVIPTRNRVETLKYSLQTVLSQNDPSFEIIVSDNSTDELTYELIKQISDDRIVYVRTPNLLSMTDNWNHAFNAVNGDYVLYIGDDDGICVNGLGYLRTAIDKYSASAYKWNTSEYQWPIDDQSPKIISLASNPPKPIEYNLRLHARLVMRCGGWFYYKLPGVYHAAVKKSVMDKIEKSNNGKLFLTTQPDLFIAMAVPQFCNSYIKLSQSVTIQGRSAKSNAGSDSAYNGKDNIQTYINEFGDYKVPELLADFPFDMGWFMEPFYTAQKYFNVYDKSLLNYSAIWAFAVRIGFVEHEYVMKNYQHFNKRQNFSLFNYLFFHTLHSLVLLRGLYFKNGLKISASHDLPKNIFDFANHLTTIDGNASRNY